MRVGFFLSNDNLGQIDCSNVENGNPGIGGTHYAMLLVSTMLSKIKDNGIDIILFAKHINKLPSTLKSIQVENLSDLANKLKKNKIDILVVNKIGKNTVDKQFFVALKEIDVKIIIWAHCFIPHKELNYYAKNSKVTRIIAVSREQLLTWVDHPIFKKASYIYNICNYPDIGLKPFVERGNNVVYIGGIYPLKGLHLLTKAWPKVIKEVPDAHLYIIGGALYKRNVNLGPLGLADRFYEKELLAPIINSKGEIHPSVTFCGIMGNEKVNVINECKVGVPNPSGKTETFGYTAIEMQLGGCLIATKKCPGYIDTVNNDLNILYNRTRRLASSIISLLKICDYDPTPTIERINHLFSKEVIVPQWIDLLKDVSKNRFSEYTDTKSTLAITQLKVKNRKLQILLPFLPPLVFWEDLHEKVQYYWNKLIHLPTTLQKIYYIKIKHERG